MTRYTRSKDATTATVVLAMTATMTAMLTALTALTTATVPAVLAALLRAMLTATSGVRLLQVTKSNLTARGLRELLVLAMLTVLSHLV